MNRHIQLSTLLLVLVFSASCRRENWPCINGKGEVVTATRDVTDFSQINFQDEGTVYITYDSVYSVKIEAQQNIIDDLKTELKGSELKIYNRHCIVHHQPIKIYITTPNLEALDLSGSGNVIVQSRFESSDFSVQISGSGDVEIQDSIVANDINADISGSGNISLIAKCNSFAGKISGSGNITTSGICTTENFETSGSGKIHAFDLYSQISDARISGSGDMELNVSNTLSVNTSGSGDVYYKGNPTITSHTSGSGDLIHVN